MNKKTGTVTHQRYVGKAEIDKLIEQTQSDHEQGIAIMDSAILNTAIKGYVLYSVNLCDSLTGEQRSDVMSALRQALENMTATNAENYYNNTETRTD